MKRFAKLLTSVICLFAVLSASISPVAASVLVQPQSASNTASPDILITSILGSGNTTPGSVISQLDDLEIYNQSSAPINLSGWSFTFTLKGSGACANGETATVAFPSSWLLAKDYFTFTRADNPTAPGTFRVDPGFVASCPGAWLASIQILQGNSAEQTITIPNTASFSFTVDKPLAQQKQRSNSSSSARTLTGDFATDYPPKAAGSVTLYSDSLYMPPTDTAGLKIVELLPNSVNCGPTDTTLDCNDFAKLYNSSNKPVDLSQYRLRTSYGGTKSSSSNTVALNGSLAPGAYTLINTKNDGSPLILTESGGYVWLEDAYGAQIYQPIVQYPDASSTTKVGWAWASDGASWRWTSDPTLNTNSFPASDQVAASTSTSAASTLQPCAANQYRNPATNRCKLIVSAATLVPCKPGDERNPATDRCRSPLAAATSLTPCKAGQERNPATNRCRAITSAGSTSTLKPCQTGWTRNPQTNRCRKNTAASIASIQDVKTAATGSKSSWPWLIGSAIAAGAIGYALYEWRRDALLLLDKIKIKTSRIVTHYNPLRGKRQLKKMRG